MDLARSLFQAPTPVPVRQRRSPSTTSNHFLSLLFFHESNSLPTAALIDSEQLKNFQFMKKTFETVLAGIIRDRNRHELVILCPVQQSLMGIDAISKLEWEWGGIDEEFILSHIARVPERDRPVTKGLTVGTLNGRSLIVTDTTVTTAKGFKLLKQARLVSERIFYDNEGRGWVIQFIDRPLVGIPQKAEQTTSTPSSPEETGADGAGSRFSTIFTPATTQSDGQHSSRPGRRSRHRPSPSQTPGLYRETRRRLKGRPVLTLQIALQRFPGVSQRLEQLIMDFNDATMTKNNLDDIRTDVEHLLADSVNLLNQVDKAVLSALLDEYGATSESLDQLLENYIMNSTYDIVFFKITLQLKQQDWDLAEAIRELGNLDLGQVGLPDTPQHYQSLVSALNEFQSIGVLRTPEEKLSCLVQSIKVTSTLSGGADDLIPILLLTVLRSGISNLASNLYYMKNFVLFGDSSRGEYGYSLSTLEAVSRYILSHARQLSPLSTRNQEYWEKVCSGDLNGVKRMYAEGSQPIETRLASPILPRRPSATSLESNSDIPIDPMLTNTLSASSSHSRDAEGNNGVLLACKAQQVEVLRYLIQEQGNSVDVSNYEGRTPLMMAVDCGNIEITRTILRALSAKDKHAIDKQDVLGNTAMHVCVNKGNIEVLEELLNAGPNLGLPNNEGNTPLIIAARMSSDKYDTSLIIAAKMSYDKSEQNSRIIPTLASRMKPQDFDRQNNSGDTAIHFIVDTGLIADLVKRGANPDIENYAGWTPLLKWALHDNNNAVRGLLATERVDALATDSRGYTSLHMACLRGNLEMVQMLYSYTPIDIQSAVDGSTLLQLACQSNSASVVEFLLQKGANPKLRDWTNESPADMTNDAAILDMLDNATLFWDSRHDNTRPSTTVQSTVKPQRLKVADEDKTTQDESGKRVIRVVRGTMEQDGKVRYIVKSGSTSDPLTIVTMPRSLEDFQFLRQNLLAEGPDACIPSLENFYSPFLLPPSRPSKMVLAISARRLNMFLNYLSDHPVLANHELVWEFMLMPELDRDMITQRSQIKQDNTIDSIFDNFPPAVENLDHEETYFKHLNDEILKLDTAIQQVRKHARNLSRSTQDVPQQLEILSTVFDQSYHVSFDNKNEYVQALKAIASTQTTMHTSDIESLGNLFEDFSFVIDGTLKALKHPKEVITSIRQLRAAVAKAEQNMRRNDTWWSGLSSIGEGAKTAFGGAGAALGAVGHGATSTFEAVSGLITPGGGHSKAASESAVRGSIEVPDRSTSTSPLTSPSRRSLLSFSSSTPPPPNKKPIVIKLSSNTSQTNLSNLMGSPTPTRPRPRPSLESASRTASASSLLTYPFSSIAAVASAATGHMSLDEMKDKIEKASSLLNSLHGSLFEELSHLQNHHTKELERAMRDFGARQLQIEKSRLRDMIEILEDLRIESSSTAVGTSGSTPVSVLGSRSFMGSTRDLTVGRDSRGISRQSSMHGLSSGIGSSSAGASSLFDFDHDEKAEARTYQRQYELQRKNSTIRPSDIDCERLRAEQENYGSSSVRKEEEDPMSEKTPFDG
ncbi:hypothetical protein BC939DRAFT_462796 [Gamsiella multidivaricata]|uniref:uncharacterized protein n=1 Tax=Gamsiella multidivaricata TaxID=101098 RepID=UPI00221FA3B4|nr:uncharacterized protein BC939DRAFT_462796 [Gamsiella multidivaricata]KAG0370765.1 hypothetical protein BGZ54_004266 [Gamsiella multidivaricata]KAI7818549.1 hypothetical protein BC939DRAFT_462796 [Gamsiella multidivaricata]